MINLVHCLPICAFFSAQINIVLGWSAINHPNCAKCEMAAHLQTVTPHYHQNCGEPTEVENHHITKCITKKVTHYQTVTTYPPQEEFKQHDWNTTNSQNFHSKEQARHQSKVPQIFNLQHYSAACSVSCSVVCQCSVVVCPCLCVRCPGRDLGNHWRSW